MWKIGYMSVLAVLTILSSAASAATINTSSCSDSDVQTAIGKAADGDTVGVPAGNCTWSTGVVIKNKGITLKGAGIGLTVITANTGSLAGQVPVWATGSTTHLLRITGFSFQGMKLRTSAEPAINIYVSPTTRWRIDHSSFDATGTGGRGIVAKGFGVIDHCVFINTKQGVAVFGYGDQSWAEPLSLGTDKAVYVEDSVFKYDHPLDGALDAYDGARYVFRHNSVNGTGVGHHGLDSGGFRSTHSFEIYENTFQSAHTVWTVGRARGGSGVVHSNRASGGYGVFYLVVNYRTCQSLAPWGRCDGMNPLDGNTSGMLGYPCRDQCGRSTPATGDGTQSLEGIYAWNNIWNGSTGRIQVHDPFGCSDPSMALHLLENRDFFNNVAKQGYSPYRYPHPLATEGSALLPPTGLSVQ